MKKLENNSGIALHSIEMRHKIDLGRTKVPEDHVDDFASVRTFKIFNTNNLWIDLRALHRCVKEKTLQMEIIVNPKTLDSGTNILQLEEAAGAAIKSFNGAFGFHPEPTSIREPLRNQIGVLPDIYFVSLVWDSSVVRTHHQQGSRPRTFWLQGQLVDYPNDMS
ncbi:unnamed protein product [Trichobilharzia regenti]|nr:unnamed protein product [Trichobilharzia regenti]